MRFAICDDMDILLKKFRGKIETYFSSNELSVDIDEFNSGEDALEAFEKGKYDAVILDVDMGKGKLNGLETAGEMRRIDPYLVIAFHTSYSSICPWEYGVDDYIHIARNSPDEIYFSEFKEIYYKCRKNAGFLDSKLGDCYLKDILYVELDKEKLIIHTVDGFCCIGVFFDLPILIIKVIGEHLDRCADKSIVFSCAASLFAV